MQIQEAIAKLDRLRPNMVQTDVKVGWLSSIDSYVFSEIMAAREGAPITSFSPYTSEDMTGELLVQAPYDELYIYRMEAELYYEQREIKKYASSMTLYNQAMQDFCKKYAREHRANPLPATKYW